MSDPIDFLPEDVDDQALTIEFKLTQLDKTNVERVKDLIYEYVWVRDKETDTLVKTVDKVNYPELVPAFSFATSHLNMMINIPIWMGEVIMEDWEGNFKDPLELYYKARNDSTALGIIDFLDRWMHRNTQATIDGAQQDYNIKMQGNYRTIEQRVRRDE